MNYGISISREPSSSSLYQRMWDTYRTHKDIDDAVLFYLTLTPYHKRQVYALLGRELQRHVDLQQALAVYEEIEKDQ